MGQALILHRYEETDRIQNGTMVYDIVEYTYTYGDSGWGDLLTAVCLEIEAERRKAVTDEQAKKIIEKISCCSNVTEFQNMNAKYKPKMIQKIYQKGVSIRQIIRLTGTSKYNVEKFIKQIKKND